MSSFYDFKIKSNAKFKTNGDNSNEKLLNKLQPFHKYEVKRSRILEHFHKSYEKKFKELFFSDESPKDLLNFFLHEQLSNSKRSEADGEYDQLLPRPENIVQVSTHVTRIRTFYVMCRNPLRVTKEMSVNTFLQKIEPFLKIAEHYNENKPLNEMLRRFKNKLADDRCEINRSIVDEFEAIFWKFSTYYEPLIETKVAKFAEFLSEHIKDASIELGKISREVLLECQNPIEKIPVDWVKYKQINDLQSVKFEYDNKSFQISKTYLEKLKALYLIHNDVKKEDLENPAVKDGQIFISRVFSLICRYESYFKNSIVSNEGYGFQAALPEQVFSELNRLFGVCEEMFASPFNCYFANFCSAFSDTDVFFGSRGSFFDYEPIEGSFECNPPFSTDLYDRMLSHIERLLSSSENPLSFIVFIPERINGEDFNVDRIKKSKFLRETIIVLYNRHQYISGAQHLIEKSRDLKYYNPCHNTQIFFLQNKPGYEKWTPTQEKVDSLLKSMSNLVTPRRFPQQNHYSSFSRNYNYDHEKYGSPSKRMKY